MELAMNNTDQIHCDVGKDERYLMSAKIDRQKSDCIGR
jgi:hypothetical protein